MHTTNSAKQCNPCVLAFSCLKLLMVIRERSNVQIIESVYRRAFMQICGKRARKASRELKMTLLRTGKLCARLFNCYQKAYLIWWAGFMFEGWGNRNGGSRRGVAGVATPPPFATRNDRYR